MTKEKTEDRIKELTGRSLRIPNGTAGKPYGAPFDPEQWGGKDITAFEWQGLEEVGLTYEKEEKQLKGTPTKIGDLTLLFKFKLKGQEESSPFIEKNIPFIVNPDPKTLWKNIESDRTDPYWKIDNLTLFAPLSDRHILVSSKRGRSHANEGKFREDDFAFKELENGWCIVVVADGAGSARASREGSAIACTGVVDFFMESSTMEGLKGLDMLLEEYQKNNNEEIQKNIDRFIYNTLGKAAFTIHKKLEDFAANEGFTLKDLSSTLIYTLFRKFESGYAFLSFGVGDCPIAVLNKELTKVTLLNWIDVGEFGGGTRFITMPEIFKSEKFATRFGFTFLADFSYLIMMSDGIYDPKFVVEANLTKIEKWQEFLADLKGKNEEGIQVELSTDNPEIEQQFSRWMDFWSPGNHDDRTLAIVF